MKNKDISQAPSFEKIQFLKMHVLLWGHALTWWLEITMLLPNVQIGLSSTLLLTSVSVNGCFDSVDLRWTDQGFSG